MAALPDVLAEHAENCILLWPVRQVATVLPHLGLNALGRSDARLNAHLDGLRLAGSAGFEAVREAATKEPGAAWAATILAAEQNRLAELPTAACLTAAVWWMDDATAVRALTQWQATAPGLGLIAGALVRRPDPHCAVAITSHDAAFATAACTAALLSGDRVAAHAARNRLGDSHAPLAMAATRLVALHLNDATAADHLRTAPALSDRILAARCAPHTRAPGRLGLLAAAALGTSQQVPELLKAMLDPLLARAAGEAFSTITGCDLALAGLTQAAPSGAPESLSADPALDDVALPEDLELPWPDPARIAAWWQAHAGDFPAGRLLGGRPVAQARVVLAEGTQRQRWAAAIEMVRATPGPLFPWADAPATRQLGMLAQLGGGT